MDFHSLLTYIKQKAALFSVAFCLIIKWQPIIDMFRNFQVENVAVVKLIYDSIKRENIKNTQC
jgi:hypothetical protein